MSGMIRRIRLWLFLLLILVLPVQSWAATCFWVGGTGTLDGTTDAAHLSNASGGAGSTCAGTGGHIGTADSLTIDGSSGAGTVTFGYDPNTSGTLTTGAMGMTLADGGISQHWGSVTNSGAGIRTYNLTAAKWTITGASGQWADSTITNQTTTSVPTLIEFTGVTAPSINTPVTMNDISFTGSGAAPSITASLTARDLTISIGTGAINANNTWTVRNLSLTVGTCTSGVPARTFTGNVTISASTSCIMGGTNNLTGTSGTQVVTTNGMTGNTSVWVINNTGAAVTIDNLSTTAAFTNTAGTTSITGALTSGAITLTAGSLTFGGTVTSTGAFTHTAGTLTVNAPITTTTYSTSNANVRALVLKRPWTLTTTGTILTNATSTNMTVTCTPGGYFVFSDSSATSKTVTYSGSEILKCIKYGVGTVTNGWTVNP